jgi:prepilin-type N-terminal cleavage/methylation domain-containing protein
MARAAMGGLAMRQKHEVKSQKTEVRFRRSTRSLSLPRLSSSRDRRGFTLTELLIVILIIGIMTGLALSAMSGATELAREQRTRAIISKLDQLIMERYESYRTRAVPLSAIVRQQNMNNPLNAARMRLYALRELMRMELPDRRSDVVNYTVSPPSLEISATAIPIASLQKSYFRMAFRATGGNLANWTVQNQGSECLYLIVSTMHDGDKNALDYFLPGEIGDTDGDGMKEILDGWGMPIEFLRWAPGYLKDDPTAPALTDQTSAFVLDPTTNKRNYSLPDAFDPIKVDPRWALATPTTAWGYALRPLIYSAGRDKKYDMASQLVDSSGNDFRYATTTLPSGLPVPNDPYFVPTVNNQMPLGTQFDADGDGYFSYGDNITNHYQATP